MDVYTTLFSSFQKSNETKFDMCVIEANTLIREYYWLAYEREKKLYIDPELKAFIYMNNYAILLDRFLNMYARWQLLKTKLEKEYSIKKIILVYNPTEKIATNREKWFCLSNGRKNAMGIKFLSLRILQTYYKLLPLLTKAESESYSPIIKYISKLFPSILFEYCVSYEELTFLHPHESKKYLRNKFFHYAQILQTILTNNEIEALIDILLAYINSEKSVKVYNVNCSLVKGFDAAEVANALAKNKKILFYGNHFIRSNNLYATKDWNTIKKISLHSRKPLIIKNTPIMERYKNKSKNVFKLYKIADKELCHHILDINRYNTFNIFPPKQNNFYADMIQYNNCSIDLNTWQQITNDAIRCFNKTFSTFLIS